MFFLYLKKIKAFSFVCYYIESQDKGVLITNKANVNKSLSRH